MLWVHKNRKTLWIIIYILLKVKERNDFEAGLGSDTSKDRIRAIYLSLINISPELSRLHRGHWDLVYKAVFNI